MTQIEDRNRVMFGAVQGIGKHQESAGRCVCAEEAAYVVNSL